jgi:hypothetical protein
MRLAFLRAACPVGKHWPAETLILVGQSTRLKWYAALVSTGSAFWQTSYSKLLGFARGMDWLRPNK